MSKKKKIILIISGVILVLLIAFLLFMYFTVFYKKVAPSQMVTYQITAGSSKLDILSELQDEGIIDNKYSALIYIYISGNTNLQAGEYNFNLSDSTKEIIMQIASGDTGIYKETKRITFEEGLRVTDIAAKINSVFPEHEINEILEVMDSESFAKDMIAKYDILTNEILDSDIYYPVEGYLFPETYDFYIDASIEDILEKMIAQTAIELVDLKSNIEDSGYTLHEIITIASITEIEAVSTSDRQKVAQVIHKRLSIPMSLGMDVTSYYGVLKYEGVIDGFSSALSGPYTTFMRDDVNPYNTRRLDFLGLPIGPICNPSLVSITAALNPAETNYVYFVADVITGEVFFFEDSASFSVKVAELDANGRL